MIGHHYFQHPFALLGEVVVIAAIYALLQAYSSKDFRGEKILSLSLKARFASLGIATALFATYLAILQHNPLANGAFRFLLLDPSAFAAAYAIASRSYQQNRLVERAPRYLTYLFFVVLVFSPVDFEIQVTYLSFCAFCIIGFFLPFLILPIFNRIKKPAATSTTQP